MQQAGMQTSRLDQIMRQKDPELLKAVQHLATGEIKQGVATLSEQKRITQFQDGTERVAAIAKDYVANPTNTIIVSPDNRSRQQINQAVRSELVSKGTVSEEGREIKALAYR